MEPGFSRPQHLERLITLMGFHIPLLYLDHVRPSWSLVDLLQEFLHRFLVALDLSFNLCRSSIQGTEGQGKPDIPFHKPCSCTILSSLG
jgi:hypothetical protein